MNFINIKYQMFSLDKKILFDLRIPKKKYNLTMVKIILVKTVPLSLIKFV